MGAFLASRFMSDVFSGVTQGAIYALVALSLVIIWQSTHVLNFAQGAMAMFATYLGMTQVEHGIPYVWCLLASVAIGFLFGGLAERVLVRPLYGKPEINPIVVMVGFLGLLEAVASAIWSVQYRALPEPFSRIFYQYHGRLILLDPFVFFEVATAVGVMALIAALFRYTKVGLQLRASALAPEVARLLGVRVSRMLTLGWMLSSAVGVSAAVIVSSGPGGLYPSVMDQIFIAGFIAAAIGGLESPVGAIAGGIILGLSSQFIDDYWSPNAALLAPLVVLILVLMVRPQGLFTKRTARRV
jgi:branched-chain amino acid transport system permease protein